MSGGKFGNDKFDITPEFSEPAHQHIKVVGGDVIREIVEQAHMAGQSDAGIDPSYSNAKTYYNELFKNNDQE